MSQKPAIPQPRPGVLDIAPYVPGRSQAAGGARLYKLSSNETPLGPSPAAIEAYRAMVDRLYLYPDGSGTALREAIADIYGLNPERVVCGAGSDEVLNLIAHAYIGPGDEAVYSAYGFLVYPIAIRAAGGTPVVAPESELAANVDAILERVGPRTRVVFLANPNNPTGTYLPLAEVRRLHAGLPSGTLLVLDAAYAEYVRRNDYESGPFNVSSPAIAAGVAALGDRAHLERAVLHNETHLPRTSEALRSLGLEVTPSVGNFILIHLPGTPGRKAADADRFLLERGVVLRRMEAYGLPEALRMTIGSEEANEATVAAFRAFLAGPVAGAKR